MRRKVFLFIVTIITMCVLSGCQSADYDKAIELMDSGDYSAAIESFTQLDGYEESNEKIVQCKYELGVASIEQSDWDSAITYLTDLDYQDSVGLLSMCIREQGMRDNADNSFLNAVEEAVHNRMEQATNGEDVLSIINSELSRLESFEGQTFFDADLGALALQYIEGVRTQKEALNEKYSQQQIMLQEGLVNRYEALCALHEQYGIFSDDNDFQNNYVAQLDTQRDRLEALKAIDADLVEQLEGVMFNYVDSYTIMAPYTNNTEYDFDIYFYFIYYGASGVRVDESTEYFSNIKAGSQNELRFYYPEDIYTAQGGTEFACEFFWELNV